MYMKYPVETIVTSFLFLSRVWSRHTDVVCDGGRGEGDKWFDGCRWCVCQRSGPLCSPSECSDYVNQVPPCNKVGSRWWDGCYHCKCHHHGIECAADVTCVSYMNSEEYSGDFLSLGACVKPKDDRCVCGIDGVPSCTAEVIDRNAYPATTVGLEATFPSSPSLVAPRNVYFDRSYRNVHKRQSEADRRELYGDSPYYYDSEEDSHFRGKSRNQRRHHSVVKRHAFKPERHSFSSKYYRKSGIPDRYDEYRALFGRRDIETSQNNYHKNRRRFETDGRLARELGVGRLGDGVFRERSKHHGERTWKEELFMDEPVRNRAADIPPSLLVTSDNRCRFGVRWYGGGLRCYCDQDTSITCGDPSFVASRIDGFRLERAPCTKGHVWEEADSCRVCECQMSGMVLCRRSSSCPLPFLITPLTMDTDEEYYFDRKDFDGAGKGHGSNQGTDEFTGQEEERKIDWDKAGDRRNRLGHDKDTDDGKNVIDGKDDAGDRRGDNENDGGKGGDAQEKTTHGRDEKGTPSPPDVVDLDLDSTNKPNIVVDSKENSDNGKGTKGNSGTKHGDKDITINGNDNSNDGGGDGVTSGGVMDSEDSDAKRTTIVTVRECKPHSRWLDGCLRCRCTRRGQKDCDDSRCLKAEVINVDSNNATPDLNDKRYTRPMIRPPPVTSLSVARDRPVIINFPVEVKNCGRFNLGELYWVQCNLCHCTSNGPRCTARNCG